MNTLKEVAEQIMFQGVKLQDIMQHFDLKKGKSPEDIRTAVQKGLKKGSGKVERELDAIESALGRVLVKRKQV